MPEAVPPIGEVIAATTTAFIAQCIEKPRSESVGSLPDPPPLGSFVRIGGGGATPVAPPVSSFDNDPFASPAVTVTPPVGDTEAVTIYGIVVRAETGALEAGRPLTAFGLSEEELKQQQPHLYELLATRFTAVPVAHEGSDGALRFYLPPRPPRPHAQVFAAGDDQTIRLTERLDYLRTLLDGGLGGGTAPFPADEVIAALLRRARHAHEQRNGRGAGEEFLVRAGRELAALLPNDYSRLRALVGRVA